MPAGTSPISVSSADLDEDGHADLAVANFGTDDVTILLGDGTGAFTAVPPVAVGVDPGAVAVSDVNGDGDLDLVVANFNGGDVSVALGNGHGDVRSGDELLRRSPADRNLRRGPER